MAESKNIEKEVSLFIKSLDDKIINYEKFTGGCYKFWLALKEEFVDAECYYNDDHVITKIDGKFYDKGGEYKVSKKDNFLPVSRHYGQGWMEEVFEEYLKNNGPIV